jgi:hypothetical protein
MEKVPPPWEGYAPLENAWRCIFPLDVEYVGSIRGRRAPDMDRSLETLVNSDLPDYPAAPRNNDPLVSPIVPGERYGRPWCLRRE